MRLDLYLVQKYKFSRNYSNNLIKNNQIIVNGIVVNKSNTEITTNDKIKIIEKDNNNINILYENNDFAI
jgi:predicted rRNA methylase YqxC with S4 and FtsJ domains